MAAMGFSLNNLTLFGLVLAIGIVVDDAIVVVEAVEHHIEHGLAPYDATVRAMDEVSGPVIAIGLVSDGGVRALRLHLGDRGPVLPPVRLDDRGVDRHLGVQLADPEPRAGRHADQAEEPDGQADRSAQGRLPDRRGAGWLSDDGTVPGWEGTGRNSSRNWSTASSSSPPLASGEWANQLIEAHPQPQCLAARASRVGPGLRRPGMGNGLADRPLPGLVLRRLQRGVPAGDPGVTRSSFRCFSKGRWWPCSSTAACST